MTALITDNPYRVSKLQQRYTKGIQHAMTPISRFVGLTEDMAVTAGRSSLYSEDAYPAAEAQGYVPCLPTDPLDGVHLGVCDGSDPSWSSSLYASAPWALSCTSGPATTPLCQLDNSGERMTQSEALPPSLSSNDCTVAAGHSAHPSIYLGYFEYRYRQADANIVMHTMVLTASSSPELDRSTDSRSPTRIASDGGYTQQTPNTVVDEDSMCSPQPNLILTDASSLCTDNTVPDPSVASTSWSNAGIFVFDQGHSCPLASTEYQSSTENIEKQRCTFPDCGKAFSGLQAHMLTHQTERPEKCPVHTCEYHIKGFARRYDRNRHVLGHFKGVMICDFCPGSASSVSKWFNRVDSFRRHLIAVHGVQQTSKKSHKRPAPAASAGIEFTGCTSDNPGSCNTCSQKFANVQDFFGHLDDCVRQFVLQEDLDKAARLANLATVDNAEYEIPKYHRNDYMHPRGR